MTLNETVKEKLFKGIEKNQGILRLKPAWVARNFIPPGKRLGLPEDQYTLGERGAICERWIGSTTPADNQVKVENEGLSYLNIEDGILLKEAVESAPEMILGEAYSRTHSGLGMLPKIFDYSDRIPFHLHQQQKDADLVGAKSKEEAYHFLEDVDLGKHPETFFGVHPSIHLDREYDKILQCLIEWKDDSILRHSRAYQQSHGDGFHVPAGILHAPGTALTIELQEDSDVFSMLQARLGDIPIDKELLFKDVAEENRKNKGEESILDLIDWDLNADPWFYENRHTPSLLIEDTVQGDAEEYWTFYNTRKFSGKKTIIPPAGSFKKKDKGVHTILVWRGRGIIGNVEVEGENPFLDELLICHDRAVQPISYKNTGKTDMIVYQFFGPDVNPDVPMLKCYPPDDH